MIGIHPFFIFCICFVSYISQKTSEESDSFALAPYLSFRNEFEQSSDHFGREMPEQCWPLAGLGATRSLRLHDAGVEHTGVEVVV